MADAVRRASRGQGAGGKNVSGPPGDAIACYHDLLTDELAQASQAQLDDQLRVRGLLFGDRPLCTVLRPRFMSPDQHRTLQAGVRRTMGAFRTAYHAAMANPAVRAQFALLDWEERLLGCRSGFRDPSPTSRLDAFFVGAHELRFTEYNAETPAGAGYNDALTALFYGLPAMREFNRKYDLRPLPARHNVLHVLLDAFQQWSGGREVPRIGILDWREVPTYSEFLLFREYFRSQGIECEIVDPREVEYREGTLRAGEFEIDLVYKRVLLSELVEREGLETPVLQAVRDGAVCMVNPIHCKILHKKLSLAVLSDERNGELFTTGERQAIESFIPWTRRVEERRSAFRGREVDLVPFILEQREKLVLKPNDDYGGAGIVLGWEVDAGGWETAVKKALAEPYVAQERVVLPFEPFPNVVDGRVVLRDRMLDTAPFIAYGEYAEGCLTRLSTAALLNVTAGGGSTVPTFVVEKR